MYELVKHEEIYKGDRISLFKDSYVTPDGHIATKEIVYHGGAAAMLAIDDEGKILFVRQYRQSAGRETLELPAGTIEKGELPEVCAAREIEEETGYVAARITPLLKMFSAIGFCTEVINVFLCEGLKRTGQNLDEDEFINVERYTPDEAVNLIMSGEICDGKTISSLFYYKELVEREE